MLRIAPRKAVLTAVAVAASLVVAGTARAELEVGDVAPLIEGSEFINREPFKFDDLRGRYVLIELFHTQSKPSQDQVPRLDVIHEKYEDRNLVVIAVTKEPRKAVDAFVAQCKPKHVIVIESGDSSKTYGLIKGYPTAYVIGPDGKIVWKGNWADKALLKLEVMLPRAKRSPKLPHRFSAARDAAEAGRYMEARRALDAEIKAGTVSAEDRPAVDKMIKWIDDELLKQLYAAAANADEGASRSDIAKLYEGTIELERLAKECADLEVGKQASSGVRNILADAGLKRELDAWRQLAAAMESAKALPPPKAVPLYKAVTTKWKDTQAAKKAAELIELAKNEGETK